MTGPRRRERPKPSRDGIEELSQDDVERRILGLEGRASRVRPPDEAAAAGSSQERPSGLEAPAFDGVPAADDDVAAAAAASDAEPADDLAALLAGPAATDAPDRPEPRLPFEARGASPRRPATPRVERAAPRTRPLTRAARPVTRRALLTRDTTTLVAGGLLALLAGRLLTGAGSLVSPTGSPDASQVAVVSSDRPLPSTSRQPDATLGAVVDPSLGLDATPTVIPVITPRPSRTPGPGQTPGPGATPTPAPTLGSFNATLSCDIAPGTYDTEQIFGCSAGPLGGAYTYEWSQGATVIGTGPSSPSIDVAPGTTVTITVTVTRTADGSSDTASGTWTVN